MAKIRSVKCNFIMNTILTGSTFIFPLVTFPYISRILQPVGVGKVNLASSIAYYFSMFAMLGVPTYGIRACAKVRDDKEQLSRTVHEIFVINLLMGMISYVVYIVLVSMIPRLRAEATLYYIMSTTIFFNVIGVEWLYKGLEQYSYITARSILFKIFGFLLMFAFVKESEDYILYGAISVLSGVGSNILNFLQIRKHVYLHPVGNYHFRKHFNVIAIFFLMSVATTIYTNLDTVMLGFMTDDEEVGYYTAAVKVKNILVSFVTALSTVLLPRVAYYIEHGMKEKFYEVTRKALNFIFLTALPLVVYFIAFAKESVIVLSGDAFYGAILPMQIIMPSVLFIGLTNVLGIQTLVPLGLEKKVFYSVLVGAIVDLIINMICIPLFLSSGASVGTVVAEFFVLLVQLWFLRDQVCTLFEEIQLKKIIIGILCGLLAGYWTRYLQISDFLILILSGGLFFAIYGMILVFTKEKFVCNIICELRRTKKRK